MLAVAPAASAAPPVALPAVAAQADAPLLERGVRGAAVRQWQEQIDDWLARTGRSRIAVDGVFGPRTLAATLQLQRAGGTSPDGIVGPRTRAALQRLLRQARPAPFEGTVAVSEAAPRPGRIAVTGVRTGVHPGFDRVVFDLSGPGHAGWRVRYVDSPVRTQGRGDVVPLRGDGQLQVTLRGIVMPADAGGRQYDAPRRPSLAGTRVVQDLCVGNLYEGVFATWLGTRSPEPFRVFRLDAPKRVVVDVLHERSPAVAAPPQGPQQPGGPVRPTGAAVGADVPPPGALSPRGRQMPDLGRGTGGAGWRSSTSSCGGTGRP